MKITHAPQENCTNRYIVEGNDIDELVAECLPKVRMQSREFYKREIRQDLLDTGKSMIDPHAGMGSYYIIQLTA